MALSVDARTGKRAMSGWRCGSSAKSGTAHFWANESQLCCAADLIPCFVFTPSGSALGGTVRKRSSLTTASPSLRLVAALTLSLASKHFNDGVQVLCEDYVPRAVAGKLRIIPLMTCPAYVAAAVGRFPPSPARALTHAYAIPEDRDMAATMTYETHENNECRCRGGWRAGFACDTWHGPMQGLRQRCVTKFSRPSAHSCGGRAANRSSLSNMGPDNWQWHMYDNR